MRYEWMKWVRVERKIAIIKTFLKRDKYWIKNDLKLINKKTKRKI